MSDAADHTRLRRPWRRAFIVYAAALVTATHWPQFVLAPEIPATDKSIHAAAFGLLAVLLAWTGWVRRLWLLGAIVAAWALLDELSQGIPVLKRVVAWDDAIANLLGVAVAVAWIWALRRLGGEVNRRRLRLDREAWDTLFTRRRTWLIGVSIVVACVAPLLTALPFVPVETRSRYVLGAMVLAGLAGMTAAYRGWREERRRMLARSDWTPPAAPSTRLLLEFALRPLVVLLVLFVLAIGGIYAFPPIYAWLLDQDATSQPTLRVVRFLAAAPMASLLDRVIGALILAVAVRVYRGRLARYHDRHEACERCRHALRGLVTCPECGTAVR